MTLNEDKTITDLDLYVLELSNDEFSFDNIKFMLNNNQYDHTFLCEIFSYLIDCMDIELLNFKSMPTSTSTSMYMSINNCSLI